MDNTGYILSKAEAREMIMPFANDFYSCIKNGFTDFYAAQAIKPVMENHTKSTVLWDFILQNIKALVIKHKDVFKLEKKQRMYLLVIRGKIAVKFKKFDEHSLSANIRTKQVGQFRNYIFELQKNVQLFPMEIGWKID